MNLARALLSAAAAIAFTVPALASDPAPLIPRAQFFAPPRIAEVRISPDGRRLAWLQRGGDGVPDELWVRDLSGGKGRVLLRDGVPLRDLNWSHDGSSLFLVRNVDRKTFWRLYTINAKNGGMRDVTSIGKVSVASYALHPAVRDKVLLFLSTRGQSVPRTFRVSLADRSVESGEPIPQETISLIPDDSLRASAGLFRGPDGRREVRLLDAKGRAWQPVVRGEPDDELRLLSFSARRRVAFLLSSIGSDTARLVERDLTSGKERLLGTSENGDPLNLIVHPTSGAVQAFAQGIPEIRWTAIDQSIAADLAAITKSYGGGFDLVSRDDGDKRWILLVEPADARAAYVLWNRTTRTGTPLFENATPEPSRFASVEHVEIPAGNGKTFHGLLTGASKETPRPLVILLNAPLAARSPSSFDPEAQLLANRGYSVLRLDLPGVSGYGKKALAGGVGSWTGTLQRQIIEAVRWAVQKRIATAGRVALVGNSYGGYIALTTAAAHPDEIAAVAVVSAPVGLEPFFAALAARNPTMGKALARRIGDLSDPALALAARKKSADEQVSALDMPLLIVQGAADEYALKRETDRFVRLLSKAGARGVYVVYNGEGHELLGAPNRLDLAGRLEAFLARHLGGRFEPQKHGREPGSVPVVTTIEQAPQPSRPRG